MGVDELLQPQEGSRGEAHPQPAQLDSEGISGEIKGYVVRVKLKGLVLFGHG